MNDCIPFSAVLSKVVLLKETGLVCAVIMHNKLVKFSVIDCRANFSYIRIISFIRVEDRTCGDNLKFRYERKMDHYD